MTKRLEVDFYIPSQKMAIQASFSIIDSTTFERETKTLARLSGSFDIQKAIIVTYDQERTIETGGLVIEVIPAWKWVLKESIYGK